MFVCLLCINKYRTISSGSYWILKFRLSAALRSINVRSRVLNDSWVLFLMTSTNIAPDVTAYGLKCVTCSSFLYVQKVYVYVIFQSKWKSTPTGKYSTLNWNSNSRRQGQNVTVTSTSQPGVFAEVVTMTWFWVLVCSYTACERCTFF